MRGGKAILALIIWAAGAVTAAAQAPVKIWTGTAGAGLALTSGNSDTSTVNAAYDVVYDPKTRNVVKSDGLLIRGKNEGELSSNRLGLNVRDEYQLTTRVVVFGQNQYLKDQFKNIDYLIAPTGGVGYKLIDTDRTKFSVDGGAGGVWEKNPGIDVRTSGALTAGEKFVTALTSTATLTQSFAALWKTNDFEDSLYTVGIGIAAAISSQTQLKVEILDVFKNRPPTAATQKNDVAVLMSIVYKM